MHSKAVVLSLSGHDPSGGAGIQADIESIAAAGCHAASVITCLTVQDTRNVYQLEPVDATLFYQQAERILHDMPVAVIKIGLLACPKIVQSVVRLLCAYPNLPVVYDPVLAAGGGKELSSSILLNDIRSFLLDKVSLLTPNLPEALRLLGQPSPADHQIISPQQLDHIAQALYQQQRCEAVLLTGTHNATNVVYNRLYVRGKWLETSEWQRLPHSYHGSGCTLASAIAAQLANGQPLRDAVRTAQAFTWQSLAVGFIAGKGQYLPNRIVT
ncbi:MAG: bifunctional hydroxymethylpyrimidine kinase/phosphomethylpyrimidine kinase [bacterium]